MKGAEFMVSGRQKFEFDARFAEGFDPGALPRSVNVGEALAAQLRQNIMSGELPPHAPVPELGVGEAFGVGRAQVRDAIRLLEAENLVRRVPQSGTYVTPISARLVRQGGFLRLSAEEANVRDLAGRIEDATITRLRKILEDQEEAVSSRDKLGFHGLDEAFHAELFRSTDRSEVWDWLQPAKCHVDRARYSTLGLGSTASRALSEHRAILVALEDRDTEKTASAMRTHLQRIEQLVGELDRLEPNFVEK